MKKPLIQQFLDGDYRNPSGFEEAIFKAYQQADGENRVKLMQCFGSLLGEPENESAVSSQATETVRSIPAKASAGILVEKTVNYERVVNFTGRNGEFKQIGITLEFERDVVTLQPITSKRETGRCRQQIPRSQLGPVIEALQEFQCS